MMEYKRAIESYLKSHEIALVWHDDILHEYDGFEMLNHPHEVADIMSRVLQNRNDKGKRLLAHIASSDGKCESGKAAFKWRYTTPLQGLLLLDTDQHIDFATTLYRDTIADLLDGHGSVSVLDFQPRIVPLGYTPEYMIVRAARTSLGAGLKQSLEDTRLLQFLFTNKHTSPLEMCSVTLRLQIPLVLMTQFLRHRSGKHCKLNVFSQRYAEVTEDMPTYNPLQYVDGIRTNGGMLANKQSSMTATEEDTLAIRELMKEANEHQRATQAIYHKMVEAKLAPEIARFWLSNGQYTTSIMQFDLNNLLHLLRLRDDVHAQKETQVFAHAIYELCKPLFPTIFAAFDNERHGFSLSSSEIETFAQNEELVLRHCAKSEEELLYLRKFAKDQHATFNSPSRTERDAYQAKNKRLRW
jgi:thymidylate synthase (FAD)